MTLYHRNESKTTVHETIEPMIFQRYRHVVFWFVEFRKMAMSVPRFCRVLTTDEIGQTLNSFDDKRLILEFDINHEATVDFIIAKCVMKHLT